MRAKPFLDTNVLIYAVAQADARSARAEELLAAGGMVSIQILNEFVSVARRKISMSWGEVMETLDAFRVLCPGPVPITIQLHEAALKIAEKYGYNIYDALVLAAAMEVGCETLYSGNFQDGQIIEGLLTIRNPFVGEAG